ncbi:unnamed protein product [Vicia faba]|uniref:Uncharacterized protein n=1 Tax=Vicia faba TaxID=3906 RepID=A0AAV1B9I4_VICFA|nr:unnamed protein product [Vicia faba]
MDNCKAMNTPMGSGTYVDQDESDLKSALGKRRRDGKSALPQPLTSIQRLYISRLVEKYGADFQFTVGVLPLYLVTFTGILFVLAEVVKQHLCRSFPDRHLLLQKVNK